MHDAAGWRDEAATRSLLRGWRRAAAIDAATSARAHAALGGDPSAAQWRGFLDLLGLWLGVALLAAGAICFIAANWDEMGKFLRLYGLQALLVAAVIGAARLGLSRLAGQAVLWLAMVLLGGLLALIGQTYQTGADTWELFALWAALSLPWVLAGRHAALWLTWALLLNVALTLWLDVAGHLSQDVALGLLNALLLLAWELAGTRWPEFSGHIGRRLLAFAMIASLSFAAMDDIFGRDRGLHVGLLCWLAMTLVAGLCFLHPRRDLPVLAMLMLGVIAVVTSALAEFVFSGKETAFEMLALAMAVLVQATAAAFVLRRLAREEAA
ncbi:DUF2157 domain-containing protein [Lysobacter brunescens]|uniref:DUF2157 domain-containing protein n=1 Tax=Lysobacter brunescens TaxID=262323 RepID=A0ABW2Y9C7_9GAMM